MRWLPLRVENIPTALRVLPAVLWRAEPRTDGKPAKVPYRISDPRRKASSTNPQSWGLFSDAVEAYAALRGQDDPMRGPVAGVAVVLVQDRETSCIDLDRVIDEHGALDVKADTIVGRAGSYTEISPSGRGLHVFLLGAIPEAIVGDQIEIYSTARVIAVTGHQWPDTPDEVRPGQNYLDWLVARAKSLVTKRPAYTGPILAPPDDLAGVLLAKLASWNIPGQRIKRWAGGYLVELDTCPWANEHTTGSGGAAVIIHPSGAYDFTCLHAHCAGRTWRDFRARMESPR
jgi:hypothetical protein